MKTLTFSKRGMIKSAGMLLVLLISVSCSKSSSSTGTPGANEVWIQNMAFSPSTITVTAPVTIKWTNKDGIAHTVTSNTGLFDSGNMGGGSTFSQLFDTPGSYPYHCTIHPDMTGTVIVN